MSEAPLSNEDGSSDEDSLFGDSSDDCLDAKSVEKGQGVPVASRKPPHIPGLRVYPDLLSAEEACVSIAYALAGLELTSHTLQRGFGRRSSATMSSAAGPRIK